MFFILYSNSVVYYAAANEWLDGWLTASVVGRRARL